MVLIPAATWPSHPSVDSGLQQMHAVALEQFRHAFPVSKPRPTPEPWQRNCSMIHTHWHHRKCLRAIRGQSLFSVFQAWHHAARDHALKKRHRRASHQLRVLKFEDLLHQAHLSATRHDMHNMFRVINRTAPKNPVRRMQLRDDQGRILTPYEEHAMLTTYVKETWDGTPLQHITEHGAPGVPFTVRTLALALGRIPTVKSVASICGVGIVCSAHACAIAPV